MNHHAKYQLGNIFAVLLVFGGGVLLLVEVLIDGRISMSDLRVFGATLIIVGAMTVLCRKRSAREDAAFRCGFDLGRKTGADDVLKERVD